MPAGNITSARVLEKAGSLEGRARRYLKIDGRWQDHDLYALLHRRSTARAGEALMQRRRKTALAARFEQFLHGLCAVVALAAGLV